MRTSHLADERGNTACGYPWEPWQDPTTRITLQTIREEPDRGVRLALIGGRERQVEEDRQPVQQCPACMKATRVS